jgi:hypothetical protein
MWRSWVNWLGVSAKPSADHDRRFANFPTAPQTSTNFVDVMLIWYSNCTHVTINGIEII